MRASPDSHQRCKVGRSRTPGPLLSFFSDSTDDARVSLFTLREPDVPAWAPLLYQLQLLDIRDKPDPLTLPVTDRIRIGNQKRERGNFHFQREEYYLAARAYSMALSVLTTRSGGTASDGTPSLSVDNIYVRAPGNVVIGTVSQKIQNRNVTDKSAHLKSTSFPRNTHRFIPSSTPAPH